jgi:hypothetical protein
MILDKIPNLKMLFLILLIFTGCVSQQKKTSFLTTNRIMPNEDIMLGSKECRLLVFQGVGTNSINYLSWEFITQEKEYYFLLEKMNLNLRFTTIGIIKGSVSPKNMAVMQCFQDSNITNTHSYYRVTAIPYENITQLKKNGGLNWDVRPQIIKIETNNKNVNYSLVDSNATYVNSIGKYLSKKQ